MSTKKPIYLLAAAAFAIAAALPWCVSARSVPWKLPYEKADSFVVVQGYDSPPTHVKKDEYAIDFSKDGCSAYGDLAVAASAGQVLLAESEGYNGGYGSQVLIDHGDGILTRYAHLISGTVMVHKGEYVPSGATLGEIGNTGLVAGLACFEHPGAHLHFAAYVHLPDGDYAPVKAEPISGYRDVRQGKWYVSDNAPLETVGSGASSSLADIEQSLMSPSPQNPASEESSSVGAEEGTVFGGGVVATDFPPRPSSSLQAGSSVEATASLDVPPEKSLSPDASSIPNAAGPGAGAGAVSGGEGLVAVGGSGVVAVVGVPSVGTENEVSTVVSENPSVAKGTTPLAVSPAPMGSISASFDPNTLLENISWQSSGLASGSGTYRAFDLGNATSLPADLSLIVPLWSGTATQFSYDIATNGASHVLVLQVVDASGRVMGMGTSSVNAPAWNTIVQGDSKANSSPSWYSDNWYDLGTGFYGTVRSLTLDGFINNAEYSGSSLYLDEFLDAGYTKLNRRIAAISNVPFTATSSQVTVSPLNIALQPNKYYRLSTYQDYQNRSVILRGTSVTGTAMSNGFVYGVGRVETTSAFYPYLAWTFEPDYPPLVSPNPVARLTLAFDAEDSALGLSWPGTTDSDTTSSLLTYEVALATSSSVESSSWKSVGDSLTASFPVGVGNAYTIGVRARDDLGNISLPLLASWTYPLYIPLPSQLLHDEAVSPSPEKFHVEASTTVMAVGLFTQFQRGNYCCSANYATISADDRGSPGSTIATSLSGLATNPAGEQWLSFPDPAFLPVGDYWLSAWQGPSPLSNPTTYFGEHGLMYFRFRTSDGL